MSIATFLSSVHHAALRSPSQEHAPGFKSQRQVDVCSPRKGRKERNWAKHSKREERVVQQHYCLGFVHGVGVCASIRCVCGSTLKERKERQAARRPRMSRAGTGACDLQLSSACPLSKRVHPPPFASHLCADRQGLQPMLLVKGREEERKGREGRRMQQGKGKEGNHCGATMRVRVRRSFVRLRCFRLGRDKMHTCRGKHASTE